MSTFEAARPGLLWDATAVPNAFFCEYMPAAPEGYAKVYLYGLMWAHSGVTDGEEMLDEAARALHMDRTEVERALRYWERCRLVERVQDMPPVYRFMSVNQVMLKREQMPEDDAYEAFAQAIYSAFGDRRKLHGGETVLAYEWVEQYHLPAEVVLMLVQHMIATRGVNFSFKEAQKVAIELCEEKVQTIEQAEILFSRSESAMRGARKVLSELGMKRAPSLPELDMYLKWTEQWGFQPAAIKEACKETTSSHTPTFAYLDKVLERVHSRMEGQTITAKAVQKTFETEREEAAAVRELMQALGQSIPVVDDGLRETYRSMQGEGGHELVMLVAREVMNSGRVHTVNVVKQLLDNWAEKGITTVAKANAYLAEVEKLNAQVRLVMDVAGAKPACNKANQDLVQKWQQVWKLPQEIILCAAQFAHGNPSVMKYIDTMLADWHQQGIVTVEEARAAHERFVAQKKAQSADKASGTKRVVEQGYSQRTYDPADFDDIPEELLEEAKRQ